MVWAALLGSWRQKISSDANLRASAAPLHHHRPRRKFAQYQIYLLRSTETALHRTFSASRTLALPARSPPAPTGLGPGAHAAIPRWPARCRSIPVVNARLHVGARSVARFDILATAADLAVALPGPLAPENSDPA